MRIEYLATRNLAPGHDLETTYEIVVFAATLDRNISAAVSRQTSLDRSSTESELRGMDRSYDVQTDHIPIGQGTRVFEEFLESVINNESFIFDPDSDTVEIAVNPLSVTLESTSYRPTRSIPGHYQYSFTVRVI